MNILDKVTLYTPEPKEYVYLGTSGGGVADFITDAGERLTILATDVPTFLEPPVVQDTLDTPEVPETPVKETKRARTKATPEDSTD